MTDANLSVFDVTHRSYLQRNVIRTVLYALAVFTVNGFLLLLLSGAPWQTTRPWTLFRPYYWQHGQDTVYLMWQILLLTSCAQVAWRSYNNFREVILNQYYQQKEQWQHWRTRYSFVAALSQTSHFIWRMLRAPVTYRKALYQVTQILLIASVAWLLWTNIFLYLSHATPSLTLNMKFLLDGLRENFMSPAQRLGFLESGSLSAIAIVTTAFLFYKFSHRTTKTTPNISGKIRGEVSP